VFRDGHATRTTQYAQEDIAMPIVDKVNVNTTAKTWPGKIPLESLYTVGMAGERFFREIKDNGKFWGTHCPQCNITYFPAQLFCECCFEKLSDWQEVATKGSVETFTVVHVDLDGQPLAQPQIVAFVRLAGADGGLIHFLGEVAPDEIYIGQPVEAVFKPQAEREGSILDIRYFRPV
jgi:uncharacterized OB-fold protein